MLKISRNTNQARIATVLILTSILSLNSGLILSKNATADSVNLLPETTNTTSKQNNQSKRLPRNVARAVLQNLIREGVPITNLEIIDYSQQTWNNGCLELPQPDEFCTQALVSGWQVVVSNGREKWIYHTNNNGSSVRLANSNAPSSSQLPTSVKNAVLRTASRSLQQPVSQLNIIQAQQKNWSGGCLELARIGEGCTRNIVPGWRVTVGTLDQSLVYHTNETGSVIRLNQKASEIADKDLPQRVRDGVLQQARKVSGLSTRALSIVEFKQTQWADDCDRSSFPNACDSERVLGWEVIVGAGSDRWVFVSNADGSQINLVNRNSNSGVIQPVRISAVNLPPELERDVVFRQLSGDRYAGGTYETVLLSDGRLIRSLIEDGNRRSVRRLSSQQVQQFQQLLRSSGFRKFNNLNYPAPKPAVERITHFLTSPEGTVQYNDISQKNLPQNLKVVVDAWNRINNSQLPEEVTSGVVPIPKSELPPALDRDMVFRQISSGGFAGRTYQTVLLNDGRLIRVRIGDANDSERTIRRISTQQLRQFQQLVERSRFSEFANLSYPAPNGAADYITYTLTGSEGTIQYNDISQNNLPDNLQQVVKAWNQIANNAQ